MLESRSTTVQRRQKKMRKNNDKKKKKKKTVIYETPTREQKKNARKEQPQNLTGSFFYWLQTSSLRFALYDRYFNTFLRAYRIVIHEISCLIPKLVAQTFACSLVVRKWKSGCFTGMLRSSVFWPSVYATECNGNNTCRSNYANVV